ncbi:MAG: YlcI/YnfO family protein [Actinomycetota bacterium]|jgi:plasmid stability protein
MRTTIRIDDSLYRAAKAQAARSGRSVSDLIEDAVREALQSKVDGPRRPLPDLPVHGGSGLMPGVDLSDSASLRDLMDQDEHLDAMR